MINSYIPSFFYFKLCIYNFWWLCHFVLTELCFIFGSLQIELFFEPFLYKKANTRNSGKVSDEHLSERWTFILFMSCIDMKFKIAIIYQYIILVLFSLSKSWAIYLIPIVSSVFSNSEYQYIMVSHILYTIAIFSFECGDDRIIMFENICSVGSFFERHFGREVSYLFWKELWINDWKLTASVNIRMSHG